MNGFDESWLREYRTRMTAMRGQEMPLVVSAAVVEFDLTTPVRSLNKLLRMHWAVRREYRRGLSTEIARQVMTATARLPFVQANVIVTRYAIQELDTDNLYGGCKDVVDCLLIRSETHPFGLGIIVDDAPAHMTLEAHSVRVGTRREQRTHVRIERLT